jgi:hypothetical protein
VNTTLKHVEKHLLDFPGPKVAVTYLPQTRFNVLRETLNILIPGLFMALDERNIGLVKKLSVGIAR